MTNTAENKITQIIGYRNSDLYSVVSLLKNKHPFNDQHDDVRTTAVVDSR